MRSSHRMPILLGIALALLAVAVLVWTRQARPSRPAPNYGGYYSGPLRSKGSPDSFFTEGGKRVPPPPGASLSAAGTRRGPTAR